LATNMAVGTITAATPAAGAAIIPTASVSAPYIIEKAAPVQSS
jgi:hypothetical protein